MTVDQFNGHAYVVLILVVMEEGRRLSESAFYDGILYVLILVVMEEGRRQ